MNCENLQGFCLHKIAENFEQYFVVYSTTKDAKIKRMFELLKRAYSYQFVQLLDGTYVIEDKHLDFFINTYLKVFDTCWIQYCQWKSVLAKMVEFGPNITKVDISWYPEEVTWDEFFCYLPNLEVISISGKFVEILRCIAKFCPNIEHIEAHFSDCAEMGFKYLCEENDGKVPCPKLKRIYIERCSTVTDDVVQGLLKNLPSLEFCDYELLPRALYSMHCQDLHNLDKIKPYKIVYLDLIPSFLDTQNIDDLLKVCVTLCPYVKSLLTPALKIEHLDVISKLQHLTTLHLENFHANLLDLNNFIKLKGSKLTSITVRKCSLSVLTLAESIPLLRCLVMVAVNLENHHRAIPPFQCLEDFIIRRTEFVNNESNLKAVCSILSSSPNLDNLAFLKCNLSSFEIRRVILKCCDLNLLKLLHFCHSSIDKAFIMNILFTCHSLKILYLCDNDFDSNNVEEITNYAKTLRNSAEIIYTQHSNLRYEE